MVKAAQRSVSSFWVLENGGVEPETLPSLTIYELLGQDSLQSRQHFQMQGTSA